MFNLFAVVYIYIVIINKQYAAFQSICEEYIAIFNKSHIFILFHNHFTVFSIYLT